MPKKPLIFSTLSYDGLRLKMEKLGRFERGILERNTTRDGDACCDKPFKDGERYMRIASDVDDREVIVVGGTIDDRETMDLYDLGNALFDWGALRIKFVVPFFGYSTMERAVKQGEAVKAKYRARLLSSIPQAPMGNRFYFLDLHAPGLPHYLEGRQAHHIYAKTVVMDAARKLAAGNFVLGTGALEAFDSASDAMLSGATSVGDALAMGRVDLNQWFGRSKLTNFILGSTDAGRMKWIESLAKELGVLPAFAYKHREGDSVESLGVSGPVKGRFVIIYDDMIRTGSSLLRAAEAYLAAGAIGVAVISTHGLFPGPALLLLKDSGLFKQIVVTDSLPRPEELLAQFEGFLQVVSVAPLLVKNIKKGRR